jgi:hypothetical protein
MAFRFRPIARARTTARCPGNRAPPDESCGPVSRDSSPLSRFARRRVGISRTPVTPIRDVRRGAVFPANAGISPVPVRGTAIAPTAGPVGRARGTPNRRAWT